LTTKSTRNSQWLLVAVALVAVGGLVAACDNFFFLRGTLHGNCDPPRGSNVDTTQAQVSNCQAPNSVCCRTSADVARTSCEYPEDCYVAPYLGKCSTPVDCTESQDCTNGTCQCTGGLPCLNPVTKVTTCCTTAEVCDPVQFLCAIPDGGVIVVDMSHTNDNPPPVVDLGIGTTVSTDMAL
jgi:hypothetical protein